MADRITPEFLHRHWCEVYGHYYDCRREDCHCICGRSMQGPWDHSDCPVELKPCPEHLAEQIRRMEEAKVSRNRSRNQAFVDGVGAADKAGSQDSEAKLDALMHYIFSGGTDDPSGK